MKNEIKEFKCEVCGIEITEEPFMQRGTRISCVKCVLPVKK